MHKLKLRGVTLATLTTRESSTRISTPLVIQHSGIREPTPAHYQHRIVVKAPRAILISRRILRINQAIQRILWVFEYSTSPGLPPKRILSSSMDLVEPVVGVGRGIETSAYSGLKNGFQKRPISTPPESGHLDTIPSSRRIETSCALWISPELYYMI